MADSQTSDRELQAAQDNPVQQTDKLEATEGEREALNTAKSELHKTMAEVVENPPSEQPPPPSLAAAADDINYEDPVPDPFNKAITYLEKHNILQIFQGMVTSGIPQGNILEPVLFTIFMNDLLYGSKGSVIGDRYCTKNEEKDLITMTASIIYQKPDNPLDFMISEIGEMKKQRDSGKSVTKQK